MGFYVATNRQKAPENAFQMRARLKAEAEAKAAEAAKIREPADVADQMPDLDALREAAARAAALVHASETVVDNPGEIAELAESLRGKGELHIPESMALTSLTAVKPSEVATEPEATRGRPASFTVAERTARILELIVSAGGEGISKPDLAAAVETKEANVQVALGKLKDAGKVESRRLPDTGKYRWFAV